MTVSAVGTVLVYNALSPLYADVSPGYAYAVILANQTAADIVDGDFTIQQAPADPNDRCAPDATKWADVQVLPQCDENPASVPAPAKIAFTAQAPLKAHSQCQYAVPCVAQFLRVVKSATGGAGVQVFVVVTRLRRVWY